MRNFRIILMFSSALALAALAPLVAFGQVTGTGTIIGSVADQSGAVIVGAEVKLTDRSTGSYEVQPTNQVGRFTFSSVKPGNYDVAVTMKGFRKLDVANQELVLGGQLTLNLTLEVGTSTQTVEVTSTPGAELQTLNSTMSTSVTGASLIQLPSIDRDAASVLYYTPTTAPNFHGAEGNVTAGQVNGATSDQNLIYLDGGNNSSGLEGDNNYVNGGHGVVPMPMESIEEFKVNTNNMTADFNASSGAEILVTTKRGTNAWHGSGYEYYQGGALNSNDWYNNFQGITKSSAHSNRFGGAIGGPISPNVWGGKTYMYFNYEGNRYPRASSVEMGVPSATLRAGYLSFVDATGTKVLYDLKTSTACGASGGMPCDPRGIGLNPVVNQIWSQYVPQANDFHYGDLTNGNSYGYIANISYPLKDDFFVGRIDHDFGTRWRGFISYRWFNENNPNTSQIDWGGVLPGDKLGDPAPASSTPLKPRYFVSGITGNISPNVTNEFHFSYTRNYWRWDRAGGVPYISGIPDGLEFGEQSSQSGSLFAPINMDTQDARQRLWAEHNFDYRDTLSWIKGNHYFQFGGDYMHQWWHFDRYDDVVTGLPEPIAQIANSSDNPVMTADYQPVPCPSGSTTATNCLPSPYIGAWNGDYADVLGMIGVSSVVVSRTGPNLTPNALGTPAGSFDEVPTYSLYFNDSWHIRPNLTLTYGLNYGVQMPPYERSGKQDILVDSNNTPMNAEAYLQSKLQYANEGLMYDPAIGYTPIRDLKIAGQNKYPYLPFYGGLSPRIGLAYSPNFDTGVLHKIFGNKETVIRGGYARFYDRSLGIDLVSTPLLGDGFLQPIACIGANIQGQCTGAGGTTPSTIFRIGVDGNTAPLPGIAPFLTSPVEPGINAPGVALAATEDSAYRPGSSDELDLSIQRQLKGNLIVEVGYTGRWAKHIFQGIDINDVPWMMVQGGETMAKAWDALSLASVAGTAPGVQPWFETALKGSSYCGGFSSCTAAVASKESPWISTDNLMNLWTDLDGAFVFGPNTLPLMNQDDWTYNDTSRGYSNYQALVATLTKRTGHGLTLNSNLTYGHDIGTATINQEYTLDNVENPWNLRSDYSPNPWDRKLVINVLSTYELPFGKGHHWTTGNSILNRVIGGWSVDPIVTWASGLPIEGYTGSCGEWGNGYDEWCAGAVPLGNVLKYGNSNHSGVYGTNGVATNGAPANGGVGLNMFANPEQVFNSFRFDYVGIDSDAYDNGPVRGHRRWNVDLGITKDTRITERVGVQLFGQAFNAFNHMQWGDPAVNLQWPAGFGVIGPGGAGEYGVIGNNYRRIIQIGARVSF